MENLVADLEHLARTMAHDAERFAEQAMVMLEDRIQRDPRGLFHILRTVKPILVHHNVAIVTRYQDVVEVLEHHNEFCVSEYAVPMAEITGAFILGMDDTPQYDFDASLLRLAFRREDVDRIGAAAFEEAAAIVRGAVAQGGSLDVVADLTNRVPARFVRDYLGVPGPDEDTLIGWARNLFEHIFVNVKHDRIVRERALTDAAALRPYLDALIAERRAGGSVGDDVLARLVRQQVNPEASFGDEAIRSNLIGMLVGAIPTISKSTALAVDELLRHPEELQGAQDAAASGDDSLLWRYVCEAMRLAPQAPGLLRRATEDYLLAAGDHREKVIPKGAFVFAATQSAMLDGDVVEDPGDFRIDRPAHHYLHYGIGHHTCIGRYVNNVVIPAMVKALLLAGPVARAAGEAGQLQMERTWPVALHVAIG